MNKQLVVFGQRAESLFPTMTLGKRLTQAVTYGLSGGWFSPMQPLRAEHPETAGRQFDYLAGYNLATRPRRDSGIDFWQLRNFAQFYDLLRLVIETRKDQVAQYEWSIVPKDLEIGDEMTPEMEDHVDAATVFLEKPDGEHTWHTWLRAVVEDMLVLDANVFWPVYEGTTPVKIEMIDPATIKKVIDESGRTPAAPQPAYQQILKGVPASDYTCQELLYFQRNWRSNAIYGFSPVEQVLMTINIGLRREVSQLAYFTEGNIPEAIAGVPDTWTPQQIDQFQSMWDTNFGGDLSARRKLKFVPSDASKIQMIKGSDALLKNEFDEWIVRIICYAFSVSPQAFTKMMNRATAYTASEEAREEGLEPTLDYLKDMIDTIIEKVLGFDDVEFMWNMEEDQDPATQSKIDDLYIKNGTWSIDEVRQRMGMEAIGAPPMIYTPKGPIPVSKFVDGSALQLILGQGAAGGASSDEPPDPTQHEAPSDEPTAAHSHGKIAKGGASRGSRSFRKTWGYSAGAAHQAPHQTNSASGASSTAEGGVGSGSVHSLRKKAAKGKRRKRSDRAIRKVPRQH